jgi:hypothetical protein
VIEICVDEWTGIFTIVFIFFTWGGWNYLEEPRDNWLGRIVTKAGSILGGVIPFVASIAIPVIIMKVFFSIKPDFMCH